MNIKIKHNTFSKLVLAGAVLALALSAIQIAGPVQTVGAQPVTDAGCAKKVNVDECKAAIAGCSGAPDVADICRQNAIKPFANVMDLCATKVNPQNCHNAVVARCSGSTGAAKIDCQKTRAADFKDSTEVSGKTDSFFGGNTGSNPCGKGANVVYTKFNFGCLGPKYSGATLSPIQDLLFSLIRFLTYGVGIAVVISIIVAGIQYSTAEGNPETAQASKNRIRSAVVGFFIYVFAFSLVQYLVPGGVFAGSMVTIGTNPTNLIEVLR
jgi:hypothetical protein